MLRHRATTPIQNQATLRSVNQRKMPWQCSRRNAPKETSDNPQLPFRLRTLLTIDKLYLNKRKKGRVFRCMKDTCIRNRNGHRRSRFGYDDKATLTSTVTTRPTNRRLGDDGSNYAAKPLKKYYEN
ncbi:hypothetical protein RRG08_001498 [Elysia crispata]|uniref:Uncharacterized protein n=1 Tax=Elysia crispata TaxID=231223 RepID=A0AAE1AA98_9GAST|nr:hypothetical protein RRG08_001498 [Elysia crispata]